MTAFFSRRILLATLLFGFAFAPAAASAKSVEILSIRAIKTQEADGDEIHFKIAVDNKAPYVIGKTMKNGNVWVINKKFTFTGPMQVWLEEMDGAVPQSLGTTLLSPAVGLHAANFTTGGVNYRLEYKIHPDAARTYLVRLNWLQCVQSQENGYFDSADELEIRHAADGKNLPHLTRSMSTGSTWYINKDIPFTKSVVLNLYDVDSAFDDFFGGRIFTAKDAGKTWQTHVISGDGARYILSYSVYEK